MEVTSIAGKKMLKSVTSGYYDRSAVALALFQGIGLQIDAADFKTDLILREAFPGSSDYLLDFWEDSFGIPNDYRLSVQERRNNILYKISDRPPFTPARIELILSNLTGCPVHITENVAPYTFRVEIEQTEIYKVDFNAVIKTLRVIKPSHLSVEFRSVVTGEFTSCEYCAGAISEFISDYFTEEYA